MGAERIIAVDWDHTLYNRHKDALLDGAKEGLLRLQEAGYKVMIFSCNKKQHIWEKCKQFGLNPDYITGEGDPHIGKPLATVFIDDRAVAFRGDWKAAVDEALEIGAERPI